MDQIHAQIPVSSLDGRSLYRDRVELLRQRVHMLRGTDRVLMTMYLENNNTFGQMGQLIGIDPANVGRRIRKMTEKLIGGEYIKCLKMRGKLSDEELALAREYFLLGKSIRKIAAKEEASYYSIQRSIRKIKEVIEDSNENSPSKSAG